MATISISGAVLNKLDIIDDGGEKCRKITGSYDLMASNGKIMAKQSFNGGYNDVKIDLSLDTKILLNKLVGSIEKDINLSMGIEQEGGK